MIICDMQRKIEAENNTPIMGLTYYLHKQHIKFLSDDVEIGPPPR